MVGGRSSVVLLAVILLTTSCAGPIPGDHGAAPPSSATTERPTLVLRHSDGGGFQAGIWGTLGVVDGCVVILHDGGSVSVPVFPDGVTRWVGDEIDMDGERLVLGEPVTLGGSSSDTLAGVAGVAGVTFPVGCRADEYWIVTP
ncbi:hypothetical protein DZG00_09035 [Clavibacter lycopersici]|uniref:Uncharacterized protein n=1 Tax=Clavibacter lycopersici TaxID=2301718 RepID=A0A399T8M4_9MICO|nr:hypothetical protein [Clavibacter lycopersici]RIJ51404.1 hypothetical protein DZG00_09035 [Clavibacter lycopersici]RIJ61743.1 hypothetical protein DZG02_05355 [Clavibacter lycopersici]